MIELRDWSGRVAGYVVRAAGLTAIAVAALWPLLEPDGRRGLVLGAAVALAVQVLVFGALAGAKAGSGHFFALWSAGTLVRLGVIGGVGWTLDGREELDPVVTLLTMAGLFFVLMLLELRTIRHGWPEDMTDDLRTSRD